MTANRGNLDLDTAGVRMLHLAAGPSRRWMQPATAAALDAAADTLEFSVPSTRMVPPPGTSRHAGPVGSCTRSGDSTPPGFAPMPRPWSVSPTADPRRSTPRPRWPTRCACRHRRAAGVLGARNRRVPRRRGAGRAPDRARPAPCPCDHALSDILDWTGTGLDALESVPAAFAAAMTETVFENAVFAAVNAGGATDTSGR